jgi:hypothetical protein
MLRTVRSHAFSDGALAYTKNRLHAHSEIPEPMMSDLREIVDWGRARRVALQYV